MLGGRFHNMVSIGIGEVYRMYRTVNMLREAIEVSKVFTDLILSKIHFRGAQRLDLVSLYHYKYTIDQHGRVVYSNVIVSTAQNLAAMENTAVLLLKGHRIDENVIKIVFTINSKPRFKEKI